jgi:hypothetical protein
MSLLAFSDCCDPEKHEYMLPAADAANPLLVPEMLGPNFHSWEHVVCRQPQQASLQKCFATMLTPDEFEIKREREHI